MHEDTMLTKRSRSPDARRFEKLIVLLIASMGLSFADTLICKQGLAPIETSIQPRRKKCSRGVH